MVKLCIFDLDGTLLDTLNNITYFVNKAMGRFSLGALEKEKVRQFVGNGARLLIERSLKTQNSDLPLQTVLNEYMRFYDSDPSYLVKPYDGIIPMLQTLKKSGINVAVLSNKPDSSTKGILNELFGRDFFYAAYGQREGVPKKPDPYAVLDICKGFEKRECVFVGDTDVDIETAKNAGLISIGVSWGFRPYEELEAAGADYIISHPTELADIIIQKNNN